MSDLPFSVWACWQRPPDKAYTTNYGFCGEWFRNDRRLLVEYTNLFVAYTRFRYDWALQSGFVETNHTDLMHWLETGTLPSDAWELDQS